MFNTIFYRPSLITILLVATTDIAIIVGLALLFSPAVALASFISFGLGMVTMALINR
jgi:hypothetical protein